MNNNGIGKNNEPPKFKVGDEVINCLKPDGFTGGVLGMYEIGDSWEYEVDFAYYTEVIPEKNLARPYFLMKEVSFR